MKRMKPDSMLARRIKPNERFGPWFCLNTKCGGVRKRWWTKARVPGTVRASRLSGGSGFRNNWEGDRV